jgi:hypothetical protein
MSGKARTSKIPGRRTLYPVRPLTPWKRARGNEVFLALEYFNTLFIQWRRRVDATEVEELVGIMVTQVPSFVGRALLDDDEDGRQPETQRDRDAEFALLWMMTERFAALTLPTSTDELWHGSALLERHREPPGGVQGGPTMETEARVGRRYGPEQGHQPEAA